MASGGLCVLLVVVGVLVGSSWGQSFNPQPNVLSGLNFQAVGATSTVPAIFFTGRDKQKDTSPQPSLVRSLLDPAGVDQRELGAACPTGRRSVPSDGTAEQRRCGWSGLFRIHLYDDHFRWAVRPRSLIAFIGQQWGKFLPMPKGLFDFPGYTGPDGYGGK
jgi:hypothetical protein